MSKIQIFESNSQHAFSEPFCRLCCLWCQRYKFLKAIHNKLSTCWKPTMAVYDVKDTNFWKQFTTHSWLRLFAVLLFMMSKIQIFESNSQLFRVWEIVEYSCLWCQRYKFLKAIHNKSLAKAFLEGAVYDVKDTNFWKQFTTVLYLWYSVT